MKKDGPYLTRIREYRKLHSMTLQQLADQCGTTAQTIQRLETDNMTVSVARLHTIATVFGITPAALLGEPDTSIPADKAFIERICGALISNRRLYDGEPDTFPALVEATGKLAVMYMEYGKGLRPANDVEEAAATVAAAAMRIALDFTKREPLKIVKAA